VASWGKKATFLQDHKGTNGFKGPAGGFSPELDRACVTRAIQKKGKKNTKLAETEKSRVHVKVNLRHPRGENEKLGAAEKGGMVGCRLPSGQRKGEKVLDQQGVGGPSNVNRRGVTKPEGGKKANHIQMGHIATKQTFESERSDALRGFYESKQKRATGRGGGGGRRENDTYKGRGECGKLKRDENTRN